MWQPISTAPRDGTWFLAIRAGDTAPFVTAYDGDLGRWVTWNLWLEDHAQRIGVTDRQWQPTHWVPIPAPPPLTAG